MKNYITKNRTKIDKLRVTLEKQREEIRTLEELETKRGHYIDCCIDIWNNFGGELDIEGVNIDGVTNYIFGDGSFEDCFDRSESLN